MVFYFILVTKKGGAPLSSASARTSVPQYTESAHGFQKNVLA
jgi:hypothetical protein